MTWLEEDGLRPQHSNPCSDVTRYREALRPRSLGKAEIARLGAVLADLEAAQEERPAVIAAVRLLLLTGPVPMRS